MKKIQYLAIAAIFSTLFSNCDDTESKFSGSPVGNNDIIALVGSVSTEETVVSSNQLFKIVVTIPQTFDTDVNIEAETTTDFGSKRKALIVIPAGQTSAEGRISAPSAIVNANFTQEMKLQLNSIVLAKAVAGTIYSISSPIVNLMLGETTLPVSNSSRCIVKFDWQGPWGSEGNPLNNNMNLVVKRDGVIFNQGIPPATAIQNLKSGDRDESFSIVDTFPDGLYSFEPFALSLNVPGFENLPYRFVVVFPDDTAKTYQSSYSGLTSPSLPTEKFKINKKTDPATGKVEYTHVP